MLSMRRNARWLLRPTLAHADSKRPIINGKTIDDRVSVLLEYSKCQIVYVRLRTEIHGQMKDNDNQPDKLPRFRLIKF
jgi:hypothetical protein